MLEWLLPHTARTGEMLATGVEEVALSLVPGEHHALLHHPAPQLAVLRLLAVEEADPVLVFDAAAHQCVGGFSRTSRWVCYRVYM